MDTQKLIALRAQKDHFFKSSPQSPLTEAQKTAFTGLVYYVPNPRLDLVVDVTEFEKQDDVQIQTTTGEARWYRRYGEFRFSVGSDEARLTIYQTPHGFFLPFVDAMAGKETYPAGRYLEPVELDDGNFHVDFNQAYSPYCAYGPNWSCPLTPPENRLKVALQAGEKIPEGEWVSKA
jgi:uncharacterized protein (DUF1684 family)